MNPSWPVVFGALVVGAIAGFMVPVRPEIRDVPALTQRTEPPKAAAAAPTEQQASAARDLPQRVGKQDIRTIPLTENAAKDGTPPLGEMQQQPQSSQTAVQSCSTETWPYRSPGCLDRSAAVADADIVVAAKRVDPVVSLRDTAEPSAQTNTGPANSASKQKIVSAPAQPRPAANASSDPAPAAEKPTQAEGRQASANAEDDGEDPEVVAEREKPAARADRRRSGSGRTRTNLDDGIPTRVYLRGPDGRLYLAPEYRFRGPVTYYGR